MSRAWRRSFVRVSSEQVRVRRGGEEEGEGRTHLPSLLPVPIIVGIDDAILAMAVVHLSCLWSQLIEFDPILLGGFSMEVASV